MSDASPKISDRSALHSKLDELLDRREMLDHRFTDAISQGYWPNLMYRHARYINPTAVYEDCVDFAREIAGDVAPWLALSAHVDFPENVRPLLMLRDRLKLVQALITPSGEPPAHIDENGEEWVFGTPPFDVEAVRRELLFLTHGETSELFASQPRVGGQSAKAYQIGKARLRALELDAFLTGEYERQSGGKRPRSKPWQSVIADCFGEQSWDTVRKWKRGCGNTLGIGLVNFLLGVARLGEPEWERGLSWKERAQKDGEKLQILEHEAKASEQRRRRQSRA